MTTVDEVTKELRKLGRHAAWGGRGGVTFINVFAEDNVRSEVLATVWPPQEVADTRWTWGHSFEHGTTDADAATVAAAVAATLPG